jgi:hypothetical protein
MTTQDNNPLRPKLESALAEVAALRAVVLEQVPAYSHVDANDLTDLKVGESSHEDWLTKAGEVQEQKVSGQRQLLERAGLTDEQITAVINGATVVADDGGDEGAGEEEAAQTRRVVATATQSTGGTRPATEAESSATGRDRVRQHFADQASK